MPNRNVIITINYTPIKYYIKNIINGDGSIAIRNALQSEITEACYGDQIFVYHTAQNSTYLKELYYLDEQAQKTNLPIAENFSSFTMPNKNITIHAIFEVPNLSNFYVSKDYGNRTFILKSYSGNEANIIIPQYYVEKGISYRFAGLGDFCFYNTPTLESINVEFIDENKNGITVGENAFGRCFNLKKLEIGNIVSIAKDAFQDCYNLFNLDLSNCKVVGKSSLSNCKKIVNADLSSCIELEEQAFDSCQNLTNVLLSGEIKIIKSRTFIDCKNLKSINLENVASIGQYAFWGCESLQSIDISNCSTFEGDNNTFNNFYGCSSLIEVLNPKKLKVIPKDAFGNCKNLKLFDFSYCDTICAFAFYNCAFEIVDLSNVKKVEENAFIGCEKLEDCILGNNENLINGNSFGASYIRYIYIDKDYDGPFGQFITDKYTYVYDDVKNPNFKIYCTLPLNLITFQFDDGRIIDKSYYKGGSDVVVPTTFSDETYNYTFTNWKRYGYNDVLNPEDFKNIWADRIFVANDYSTTYVEYIIKFYYGYDYDSSGIIGDEGDIFKQITGQHYNQQIELPTPNPTRPSDIQHDFNFHTWQHNGEDVSNLVCTGDMAIVATYNATIRKYLISWYDATGNLIYSENLEYGTMPTFNSDDYSLPTKESEDSNYFTYVCTGWTPNLNNVECEAHYYPIFSKHYYEYSIEYYYGYDFDGSQQIGDAGDLITTKTYHYYDSIEGFKFSHTYSDFRNLYTFSQWDKILVGENVNDIFNQFSNYVLKVNALYDTEIIYYKISWVDGNGNEIYNEFYTYQETPTYNEELYGIPTKLQDNYYTYTFAYWDKQIEPVTKDEVYTATFNSIIRLYNITWIDGNDNVIYVDKLPYDSVITYNINKYGIPTKSKTEFYKYVFDKWENYEVGQKVTGDQTFYSTYLLYNTIKIVNENLQLIDVSNLPTINNAVVDISDLQDNSSLEIKFSNSTLIFDNNAMKFFKDSHKKCAEIIVNLNYDNTENKKFKQEFSFTISIILDNESINNLNGDYSVIINCQTKDSYGLWQNLDGEYQEVAHESVGDSLKFTTNKTGEFICGVKISKSNIGRNILIVVFAVLAIATISITITLVIKKKKFTNNNK